MMNLSRGNVVLCKVPMPSEELREFKLRKVNDCLKDALELK
jgi:hypothetical protein